MYFMYFSLYSLTFLDVAMSMNKVQNAIKTGPFGNHSACQPLCMNTVAEATSLTLGRRVTVVVLLLIPSFCPPRYTEQRSLLRAS